MVVRMCRIGCLALIGLISAWPVPAQDNVYGGYGPGAAMAPDGRADGRWFEDEPRYAMRDELVRCCPPVSIGTCAPNDAGKLPDRYSLRITRLGDVNARPLRLFQYRRETLFRDPAFTEIDPDWLSHFVCRASRVLVVHEIEPGRFRIVWEGWQDELSFRLEDVEFQSGDAGDIIAFTYCVVGTGGCWQEMFYKLSGGPWRPLEKDETWASVYAGIPEGFSLHKSAPIDLGAMTWTRSIAREDDPNCCPSGVIAMKLSVLSGRLSVVSYDYVISTDTEN